jgi:hypothetical protein
MVISALQQCPRSKPVRPPEKYIQVFCLTIVEHKIIHAKLIAYFIQTGTREKDEKQLASSSRAKVAHDF